MARDGCESSGVGSTVFLSFPRGDEPWATRIFEALVHRGFSVVSLIDHGICNDSIETNLERIRTCTYFTVLLTPWAFAQPSWMDVGPRTTEELFLSAIEAALLAKRRIVNLILPGFSFGGRHVEALLVGKLAGLKRCKSFVIDTLQFERGMDKLARRFLSEASPIPKIRKKSLSAHASSFDKTAFISYRSVDRDCALRVHKWLTGRGFDVFIDRETLGSGDFEVAIGANIELRSHFVVILSPSTLGGCANAGDWVRREIEIAIDKRRNIVPLFIDGFSMCDAEAQTRSITTLAAFRRYNGMPLAMETFESDMRRLYRQFLSIDLAAVRHPLLDEQ
jgi:hypothetical protein